MHKCQWRSSNARKAQPSNSTQSPVPAPFRPSLSNVVPSGTVASRVRFLEDHPSPTYTISRRPSPTRARGQSRIGFGRRLTSRFGKPASRNEHPDEKPRVDIIHSYLRLNNKRTRHMEEHGVTDGVSDRRTTCSQTSGIHAQVQPQGITEKVQDDALSPWPFTPQNNTSASRIDRCGQRMDPLREVDGFGNKSFFTRQSSIFPTLTAGIGHSDMYHRDVKSRQDATMKSDMSALTTSTVRRQSVRDLFADYGIEQPPGLVSDKPEPREEGGAPKQIKSKMRCLNCSWYNCESSNWCVKCKFLLRTIKHEDSHQSLISPKGEQYYLEKVSDKKEPSSPDSSEKENLPTEQPKRQHVHSKPQPEASERPKGPLRQVGKLSSLTTKFPSFNMVQSPPKSQIASSRKVTLPELPVAPRLLNGSRTTLIVKESPFLIADRLSSGRYSNALPPTPRMDGGIYCRKTRSKLHLQDEAMTIDIDCESVACRATHEDHEPYRHSVTCSRKKERIPEETDNGYVVDTSFAEDSGQNQSSRQYRVPSQASKQYSNRSLRLKRADASHHTLGSEYIECHGYPRTGHARHGSVTSGAIGQCQHCIDDCQCSACQKTHHSVRCCMNEIHQGMVHHHHAPKAVTATVNPLDCPTFTLKQAEPFEKFLPASHARTASIVTQASQSIISTQPTSNISQIQVNIQPPSKKPTGKPPTLPKSKRSTFLKEKSKPPTPPPWISDPRIRTKSPSTTALSNLGAERTTADTALNVWAIPDPPPPFKERPTLPPPPTCDESSPERLPSRADSDSSKVSKPFSDLFGFGEKTTVPLLNQSLLEHQEELRKIEKECDGRLNALSGESDKYIQNAQPNALAKGKQKADAERKTSATGNRAKSTKTKKKGKWGLSLADKKPLPPCPNDAPVREHTLSEDETVDEKGNEVVPAMWDDSLMTNEEHVCVWRNRFLASQNERRSQRGDQENCNTPVQGVTVVVHMEGKDDLVIEADLRKGSEVRASGC